MQALVVGDRWPDTMATHRASLRPARPMTWQGRKGLATDALASSPPRNATITGRRVDLTRRPCCVGPTIGTPAKLDRALPRISFEKSGGRCLDRVRGDNYQAQPNQVGMARVRPSGDTDNEWI